MAKIDRLGKRPERFRCAEMRKLSFIKMPLPLNYVVLQKEVFVVEQLLARLRQASTRQEAETCLKQLWQRMSEINTYYRNKFGMDDPPAEWLELGRRIVDLKGQGVSPGDICKALHIKKAMYLHILAEYMGYQRRAVEAENRLLE
jgi:hypothetical protein